LTEFADIRRLLEALLAEELVPAEEQHQSLVVVEGRPDPAE
jgi:hypothetical protein